MADFPTSGPVADGVLSPWGQGTLLGDLFRVANYATSAGTGAWTANRAVYLPVVVHQPLTLYSICVLVATQNGNVDAGVYNWRGTRIVSNGGVACGAAGTQTIDVADTALARGWYFLAFASDSATAVFYNSAASAVNINACQVQQQASAYPLPATATFVAYATAILPKISGVTRSY